MISAMPRPDFSRTVLVNDALNEDIIRSIHENYLTAKDQVQNFSTRFTASTPTESAAKIWRFLKQHVDYQKDQDSQQLIRMPSRLLFDQVGDCKSMALFAAACLGALGLPVFFRYAAYDGAAIPSHVYTLTKDGDRIVIVDAVYHKFNSEKPYTYKKDYQMNVVRLSGTDGEDIGKIRVGKFLKKVGKGAFKGVKKIGLAVPRRAFRTLVALNFRGLGSKLARAYQKNPGATDALWKKMGGSPGALKTSTYKGAKRKRIFGINGEQTINGAPLAAIMAQATPLLIVFGKLLKSLGADKEGKGEAAIDKITDVAERAVQMTGGGGGGGGMDYATDPLVEPENFDTEQGKDDTPGFKPSPLMIVAGAGLLYLIFKKK